MALVQRQHDPQHRSDVRVDEISDLAVMALPGGTYLIRTAKAQKWTRGVVVGMCSLRVQRDIARALRREAEAVAMEGKYRKAEAANAYGVRMVG